MVAECTWCSPRSRRLISLGRKSFRHGDIENILEKLVKNSASGGGGGMFGFLGGSGGGKTFSAADVKRIYFVGIYI